MQAKVTESERRKRDRKRPEQLSFRGQLFQPLDAAKDVKNVTGRDTSTTAPVDAGLGEGDAGDRKGVGPKPKNVQATTGIDAPDVGRLEDDRTDATSADDAKEGKPSALDKTTAIRVQQWWRDTQEGGGLRTLSDLTESREEKLAQQYANRASAAYDQKYGIRPDEIGLPHRRTPSARWGGQDFVEAKKEAEALGDSEMLTAINEIERTNIELEATKDIDSRAREDSARELKELFPEYAEQIDADLQGFVKRALDQKIDRIEPKFKPESKPKPKPKPKLKVVPGKTKKDPPVKSVTGKNVLPVLNVKKQTTKALAPEKPVRKKTEVNETARENTIDRLFSRTSGRLLSTDALTFSMDVATPRMQKLVPDGWLSREGKRKILRELSATDIGPDGKVQGEFKLRERKKPANEKDAQDRKRTEGRNAFQR
jgi:hypothetical protein